MSEYTPFYLASFKELACSDYAMRKATSFQERKLRDLQRQTGHDLLQAEINNANEHGRNLVFTTAKAIQPVTFTAEPWGFDTIKEPKQSLEVADSLNLTRWKFGEAEIQRRNIGAFALYYGEGDRNNESPNDRFIGYTALLRALGQGGNIVPQPINDHCDSLASE